jgi:hypothetical protein
VLLIDLRLIRSGAARCVAFSGAGTATGVGSGGPTRMPRRYSVTAWARVLAGPAHHGWTSRDINQLITDWVGIGHWLPERPHKTIGLLGAVLTWHGRDNLEDRPAAVYVAREAEQLAADRARIAAQLAAQTERENAPRGHRRTGRCGTHRCPHRPRRDRTPSGAAPHRKRRRRGRPARPSHPHRAPPRPPKSGF